MWVSPFRHLRVTGYLLLTAAFRSLSRLSSALSAKASTLRSFLLSLAATYGIDVSFSSSGYLDVSVHRVPFHTLWIGVWIHEVFSCGFPHSDICGSLDICSSPQLFAAYHVFHRLLVPRHPPCALSCLTFYNLPVRHSVGYLGGLFSNEFLSADFSADGLLFFVCSRMS